MKKIFYILILVVAGSSGTIDQPQDENTFAKREELETEQFISHNEISYFSGTYLGSQESYAMLNKQGEPAIINGKKIEIPAIKYKV